MKEIHKRSPWEYYIIEDCLPISDFTKIQNGLADLFKNINVGNHVFDLHDLHLKGLSSELIQTIVDYTDVLVKSEPWTKFSQFKKSEFGYICIPKVGVSKGKRYGIHDDTSGNFKVLTFLVYVSPEHSAGTELYSSDKYISLKHVVPWKENCGIYFCPSFGVTYHDFKSDSEVRITLNLNISDIEMCSENNIVHVPTEKLKFILNFIEQQKLYISDIDLVSIFKNELDKR